MNRQADLALRREEYLSRADEAAVLAKAARDPVARDSWIRIEEGYRFLALQLLGLSPY